MSLLARVTSLAREYLFYGGTAPQDEEAFREYTRVMTTNVIRALSLTLAAMVFIWWPADIVLFADDPVGRAATVTWRFIVLGTVLGLAALLTWVPAVRRRPFPVVFAAMTVTCISVAWTAGRLGHIDEAGVGLVYVIAGVSLVLFVPFISRVLVTYAFAIVSWCGFFLLNPQRLTEEPLPGLTISQCLVCATVTCGLGHLLYHYMREGFFANQQLDRARQQLESRVQAQTADLRYLADRIETGREAERAEVARELHDELGQVLTAIRFEVVTIGKDARRGGVELDLEELDFQLDTMLETFRRMLRALRPRVLDDFGLVAATEWLVADQRQQSGLEITLRVTPPGLKVERDIVITAFRVVQESLNNTLAHAAARRVQIDISGEEQHLVLVLRDDGKGIAARDLWPSEAVGIIGMRERVRMLGGDLSVTVAPEGGTMVTARLPRAAQRGQAA